MIETIIKEAYQLLYENRTNTTSHGDIVDQLSWLFFLKYLELPQINRQHTGILAPFHTDSLKYKWAEWVPYILNAKFSEEPLRFLLNELLPYIESVFALKRDNMKINTDFGIFKRLLHLIYDAEISSPADKDNIALLFRALFELLTRENKAMGIFATPHPVARFMTQVLNPSTKDIVYDPACGTGNLLITVCEHICNTGNIVDNDHLFGRDSAKQIVQLARMNIALHGFAPTTIQQQDVSHVSDHGLLPTLHNFVPAASLILTHPPLGNYSPITSSEPILDCYEAWFLRHCLQKLMEESYARCGMVVSDKLLDGKHSQNQQPKMKNTALLRKKLLQHWNILMIVCLPRNTFGPLSSKQTYLLFFDNCPPTGKILYYNLASRLNYKPYSPARPVKDQDFEEALAVWKQWKAHLKDPDNIPVPVETDHQMIATYERGSLDHLTSDDTFSIPIPRHYRHSEDELIAPDELVKQLQENCMELQRLTQRLQELLCDHNS